MLWILMLALQTGFVTAGSRREEKAGLWSRPKFFLPSDSRLNRALNS
jgi:hypothetical protein